MDFQKIDTAEDEDELFFEGPEPEIVVPAKPARKRVARGKAAEAEAEAEAVFAAEAAPAEEPVTAEPVPGTIEPVEIDAPAGEPVVIMRGSRLTTIAMVLAAVAALFASAGLLVTLRNMATLEKAQHAVEEREAALARLPALLAEIEDLARRQRAELAQAATQRPADIATKGDLTREMTGLRFGLSRMQAPGTAALAGVVRAGQAELADRIDDLSDRVDAVERPRAARDAAH